MSPISLLGVCIRMCGGLNIWWVCCQRGTPSRYKPSLKGTPLQECRSFCMYVICCGYSLRLGMSGWSILALWVDQGLFCHDQVSSGKFLEFFNLWHNLQMFLDTMEPRTENKKSSLEKTVLIMRAQICRIISEIIHDMTLKKIFCKIGTSRG